MKILKYKTLVLGDIVYQESKIQVLGILDIVKEIPWEEQCLIWPMKI